MASNSHQGSGQSSGFRTVAVLGLGLVYVAAVHIVAGMLSPVLGETDLSTTAATLVGAGLLFPLWRRLTVSIRRPRPASLREDRTQMTWRGIAWRVVAGLLAVAVFFLLILVLGSFTSDFKVVDTLVTLAAAAGFMVAHQRLPR